MLRQFTEDERLREQYRLHEEWLRNERSMEQVYKKNLQELQKERRLRKKAEAERKKTEAERKKTEAEKEKAEAEKEKAEAEKEKAEAERKKTEAESEKRMARSVLALRKAGYQDKNIADMLGMTEEEVMAV